ncbi:MAG TPA: hypothetical protein VGR21_03270 [Cryptosporangiaceae bacterium]|nr:hypothetical protein [Cryptosporangiaceae bacterium]
MSGDEVAARASALLELGRPQEALDLLAPAAATSADAGVHQLVVVALSQLGRHEDAASAADAALDVLGPGPALARVASHAFRVVGENERALDIARAGVEPARRDGYSNSRCMSWRAASVSDPDSDG